MLVMQVLYTYYVSSCLGCLGSCIARVWLCLDSCGTLANVRVSVVSEEHFGFIQCA